MLSTFLKTYTVASGTSIEAIVQEFYRMYPKSSSHGIQQLLESHGHVIRDGFIVENNDSKMEEFLLSGYEFESLGKLVHDYRIWRNFTIKVKLDMDRTIQILDQVSPNWRMKQSSSSGASDQGTHP